MIYARKSDGFWAGERVPLDRLADKRPFSRRWSKRGLETVVQAA